MKRNKFLECLLNNRDMVVLLDTNFFIPPPNIDIKDFDIYWIDNLLGLFRGFMIHESVKHEMLGTRLNNYINRLTVCYNKDLNPEELKLYEFVYDVLQQQIGVGITNKGKNVGEVETLAYMYAKRYPIIISRDSDVVNNIHYGCVGVVMNGDFGVIQFYELLYVLKKLNLAENKILKAFYKAFYPVGIPDDGHKDKLIFSELILKLDNLYGVNYVKSMDLL